ncbi:VOC family protein [Roseibium marinum]|uniref:Glyoxalase/bleomycin resistance protein/dioxygenase superfamily protein n=1 Tax=Roseibium marinum TaxID=281252 RepID=A0A2S3UW36_9HYPH|nr:VOC family protein [Roseibium marinum]POF31790.1 glyoxalase/bleomycin resistance protein/dioxygenase superfamily protein [Roseibium marinum]
MRIGKLDHVNLRTTRLDDMIAWYADVLGMRAGPRPDFPFPGAWLYAGDAAAVHLVGIEGAEAAGSEEQLKLEHFAFTASGAEDFEALLKQRGEKYRRSVQTGTGTIAFNVWDPDGNHIHVDFPPGE